MEKEHNVSQFILNMVTAGIKGNLSSEEVKSMFLAVLFSYVGFAFILLFGIISVVSGQYYHGIFLLFMALLTLISYFYLRFSGNYRFHIDFIVFLMGVLCLYLICHGGTKNTGHLWYYVFPLLVLYTQGLRRGMWSIIILMGLSLLILFVPNIPFVFTHYSAELKVRFLASFAAVTIMSVIFEYSRKRANNELLELAQKLKKSARTDDLTGLSNRRDMRERLLNEVARSFRTGRPFSIVMCDIDHFKKVNDTYGHECGDDVLVTLSALLKEGLRQQDVLSRWGGEEFLVLLPETDLPGGRTIAERLRQSVEQNHFEYQGNPFKVTMSFGVHAPKVINEIDALIKMADQFLYEAKNQGRNRVISDY